MGHSTMLVSQRYMYPSPESAEKAKGRLESLNLLGVGMLLGTQTEGGSAHVR